MNMQDEILNLWKENKQLVIMVTHDVDEAIYMGTKVLVMEAHPGRINAAIDIDLEYPRNRASSKFVEDYIRIGLLTTMKDADKVMEKVWWPQDPDHNFN